MSPITSWIKKVSATSFLYNYQIIFINCFVSSKYKFRILWSVKICIEFHDQTPTDYGMIIINSSFLKNGTILTLLIPSYFGPGFTPRGEGYLDPHTTSSTLNCTNIKFCKVSEIHFKVSENKRSVKKYFVWLPWQPQTSW